jgi:hypothetical protein
MTLCLFRRCVRFQRAWPFVVRWTHSPTDGWKWKWQSLFLSDKYGPGK